MKQESWRPYVMEILFVLLTACAGAAYSNVKSDIQSLQDDKSKVAEQITQLRVDVARLQTLTVNGNAALSSQQQEIITRQLAAIAKIDQVIASGKAVAAQYQADRARWLAEIRGIKRTP